MGWGEGRSGLITQPGSGLAHSLLTRLCPPLLPPRRWALAAGHSRDGVGVGLNGSRLGGETWPIGMRRGLTS